DGLGIAMRRHDAHLVADPALLELLGRGLHRGQVALGAHDDADERSVDLEGVELGLHRRLRHRCVLVAHAAMSRRSCRPSKRITSAAAYAWVRASCVVSPSAVTFRTRPPAVTISPSTSAVPACRTSTSSSATRSSPWITSPFDDDSG